jgi:hypothetical protein
MSVPKEHSYRIVVTWGEFKTKGTFEKEKNKLCKFYEKLQTINSKFPCKEIN